MDHIKQAVDLARTVQSGAAGIAQRPSAQHEQISIVPTATRPGVRLNAAQLEKQRIVAHLATEPQTRSFDMLRTQALQTMDTNGWQYLAITSPTPACGKTVTAINLAF